MVVGWRLRQSTVDRVRLRAEMLGWSINQLVDAMLTEQMDRYGVPADPDDERTPPGHGPDFSDHG